MHRRPGLWRRERNSGTQKTMSRHHALLRWVNWTIFHSGADNGSYTVQWMHGRMCSILIEMSFLPFMFRLQTKLIKVDILPVGAHWECARQKEWKTLPSAQIEKSNKGEMSVDEIVSPDCEQKMSRTRGINNNFLHYCPSPFDGHDNSSSSARVNQSSWKLLFFFVVAFGICNFAFSIFVCIKLRYWISREWNDNGNHKAHYIL